MDDSVHVQVQVVEFRDAVVAHHFPAKGISLADPSEELWDPHCCWTVDLGPGFNKINWSRDEYIWL